MWSVNKERSGQREKPIPFVRNEEIVSWYILVWLPKHQCPIQRSVEHMEIYI